MWLVVGLGNPGSKYVLTRHNVGFMAVDRFLAGSGNPNLRDDRQALSAKIKLDDQECVFVKPQTFMNLSGTSVRSFFDFYKISLDQVVVLHDDLDSPFGSLKIQRNRGAGGHNGLKSINEHLGSMDYYRIKIGVGRPVIAQMDIADYVLQNFSSDEQKQLPTILDATGEALEALIFKGYNEAATKFNRSVIG